MLTLQARIGNSAVQRLLADPGCAGRPPARVAVQRTVAGDLIAHHTRYLDLHEDQLGADLLGRARGGDLDLVHQVLDELGSTDRDDVAFELVRRASAADLRRFSGSAGGQRLLSRLYDELSSGSFGDDERRQANRIIDVREAAVPAAERAQSIAEMKVFPFRAPGITVFDDAPIMADRRSQGRVWVHMPTRVLGTRRFRAETATLPTEVFISGVELPETEIIGVRMYDLGGELHVRPALYLVQLANETDTRVLEAAGEAAGIGLTLGSGALAGLGIRATMAARVLLWADRAAFTLGVITSAIRDHRGWIIERFGDRGRRFLDYVDMTQRVVAVYGMARVVFEMGRLVSNFRSAWSGWRNATRETEAALSPTHRQVVDRVDDAADEFLGHADRIGGAGAQPRPGSAAPPGRPGEASAPPATTRGGASPLGPERQLPPGRPATARERLETTRAARAARARAEVIEQGIRRVDGELAAGTHRRRFTRDDLDWLNASRRHKELAYDPDMGTYRVSEARQALAAEREGVLPRPVSRSTTPGTDFLDGAGTAWSLKGTGPGSTVESTAALIAGEVRAGRPCLGDLRGLSTREQAAVRTLLVRDLSGQAHAEVRFLPAGVARIGAR